MALPKEHLQRANVNESSLLWIQGKRAPSPISCPTLDDVLYSQLARVRVFSGLRILTHPYQISPMPFVSCEISKPCVMLNKPRRAIFVLTDRQHLNDLVPSLIRRPSTRSL